VRTIEAVDASLAMGGARVWVASLCADGVSVGPGSAGMGSRLSGQGASAPPGV